MCLALAGCATTDVPADRDASDADVFEIWNGGPCNFDFFGNAKCSPPVDYCNDPRPEAYVLYNQGVSRLGDGLCEHYVNTSTFTDPDDDGVVECEPSDLDCDDDGIGDEAELFNTGTYNGFVALPESDRWFWDLPAFQVSGDAHVGHVFDTLYYEADTDSDGFTDGEELAAGWFPSDPNDPVANVESTTEYEGVVWSSVSRVGPQFSGRLRNFTFSAQSHVRSGTVVSTLEFIGIKLLTVGRDLWRDEPAARANAWIASDTGGAFLAFRGLPALAGDVSKVDPIGATSGAVVDVYLHRSPDAVGIWPPVPRNAEPVVSIPLVYGPNIVGEPYVRMRQEHVSVRLPLSGWVGGARGAIAEAWPEGLELEIHDLSAYGSVACSGESAGTCSAITSGSSTLIVRGAVSIDVLLDILRPVMAACYLPELNIPSPPVELAPYFSTSGQDARLLACHGPEPHRMELMSSLGLNGACGEFARHYATFVCGRWGVSELLIGTADHDADGDGLNDSVMFQFEVELGGPSAEPEGAP